MAGSASRVPVAKTHKIYINGKFPRTESGRYFTLDNEDGDVIANICRGSRKDFRNAVVAARKAFPGWSSASAYLRGQILYRIAEMLEGRSEQFTAELVTMGVSKRRARKEVEASIDRLIYYAGWSDKYQQVFGTVNPVSSSHFNFRYSNRPASSPCWRRMAAACWDSSQILRQSSWGGIRWWCLRQKVCLFAQSVLRKFSMHRTCQRASSIS